MIDLIGEQLFSIGGPVYVALIAVSVVATATTVYKIVQFWQLGIGRHRSAETALARWTSGDRDQAARLASGDQTGLARVAAVAMSAMLRHPGDPEHAREAAGQEAIQTLTLIGARLRVLEAIVQAAPMLGLLGTVIGMIDAFASLSAGGGAVDPGALAGGIWVALLTTAMGLSIAITFYFVAMWLEGRVETERTAMEMAISVVTTGQGDQRVADERQRVPAGFRAAGQMP